MACTLAAQICRNNACSCDADEEAAEMHERSAKKWEKRRDEIKKQVDEWDAKHPQKI